MARPSRVKSSPKAKFAVYEDSNIPTPDSSRQPRDDHDSDAECDHEWDTGEYVQEKGPLEDISEDVTACSIIGEQTDTEVDDENDDDGEGEDRRESTQSVSSLPESSVFDTDYESNMPAMHKPYTPPSMRPTFRRPESVRRMQLMTSPTPYERNGPRRLHVKSRSGTLRSIKQSPRPRAPRYSEEDGAEGGRKEYPLVLLHMTLLPVELRWSARSMSEVLPPHVIENLQLLRSKVSETILNRGILVPHPRGEYELLEDRLLEALELKRERITKCGHFRARDSTSSVSSSEGSIRSADSGVALSLSGEDVEHCTTCNSSVNATSTAVDVVGRKWSIKVFAANGLMRAAAWSAAWAEMESVDVEILPWINADLRKQLDTIAEREEEEECCRREEDETRIKMVVEGEMRIAREESKRMNEDERVCPSETQPRATQKSAARISDLPRVYRTADIPLSMLLRNYIFLLAQDRRNIAIFALAVLAIWTSLRAAVMQPPVLDLVALPSICEQKLPEPPSFGPNNANPVATDNEIVRVLTTEMAAVTPTIEQPLRLNIPSTPNTPSRQEKEQRRSKGEEAKLLVAFPKTSMDHTVQPVSIDTSQHAMLMASEKTLQTCGNYDLAREMFTLDVFTCCAE